MSQENLMRGVKCPYCNHENTAFITVKGDRADSLVVECGDRFAEFLNKEKGCGRKFAVIISVTIKLESKQIEEE